MNSKNIGDQGEQIAVDYLLASGFEILHRNYRVGRLEIDIIAQKGDTLHFIEVKTRSFPSRTIREFTPEYAMSPAKKERIVRAAESFIEDFGHKGNSAVGLIAINLFQNEQQLRYYPDALWS